MREEMSLLKLYNSNQKSFFQKSAIAAIDWFESLEDIQCFINLEKTNSLADDLDIPWVLTHTDDIADVFRLLKEVFSQLQKKNFLNDAESELYLVFALWETGLRLGEHRYYLTKAGRELFPAAFILKVLCGNGLNFEAASTVTTALERTELKIREVSLSNFPRQIKKLIDVFLDLEISRNFEASSSVPLFC